MNLEDKKQHWPSFVDLCEKEMPDHTKSYIDRNLSGAEHMALTPDQKAFRRDGVLILNSFIPEDLIAQYVEKRSKLADPRGWASPTPYERIGELKEICLFGPLMQKLKELIGEEMFLHLNLTGWVSTERLWHQDLYLNPPFVGSYYAAVWFALDDIAPDSGPFQFVRGSNRWTCITRKKVFEYMDLFGLDKTDPAWPKITEKWVAEACEKEIARRKAKIESFIAKKGDVLIWHGRLVHQGSRPEVPGKERRALIAHYSGIDHRPDMPSKKMFKSEKYQSQGSYLDTGLDLEGNPRK